MLSFKINAKAFRPIPPPGTLGFIQELHAQITKQHDNSEGNLLVVSATHSELSVRDTFYVLNVPRQSPGSPYHSQWLVPKHLARGAVPSSDFSDVTNDVLKRLLTERVLGINETLPEWTKVHQLVFRGEPMVDQLFAVIKETGGRATLRAGDDLVLPPTEISNRTDMKKAEPSDETSNKAKKMLSPFLDDSSEDEAAVPNRPWSKSGARNACSSSSGCLVTTRQASLCQERLESKDPQAQQSGEDSKMTREGEAARDKKARKNKKKREQKKRQQIARREAAEAQREAEHQTPSTLKAEESTGTTSSSVDEKFEDISRAISKPVDPACPTWSGASQETTSSLPKDNCEATGFESAIGKAFDGEGSDGEAEFTNNTGQPQEMQCGQATETEDQAFGDEADPTAQEHVPETRQSLTTSTKYREDRGKTHEQEPQMLLHEASSQNRTRIKEDLGEESAKLDSSSSHLGPEANAIENVDVSSPSTASSVGTLQSASPPEVASNEIEDAEYGPREVSAGASCVDHPTPYTGGGDVQKGSRRLVLVKLPQVKPALPDLQQLKQRIRENQGLPSPGTLDSVAGEDHDHPCVKSTAKAVQQDFAAGECEVRVEPESQHEPKLGFVASSEEDGITDRRRTQRSQSLPSHHCFRAWQGPVADDLLLPQDAPSA